MSQESGSSKHASANITEQPSSRRNAHRLAGICLYLIAIGLIAVEILWILQSAAQYDRGDSGPALRQTIVPGSNSTPISFFQSTQSNDLYIDMLIQITRVDATDQYISAQVDFQASPSVLDEVVDSGTGRSIVSCGRPYALCPEYANENITLLGSETDPVSLPLSSLGPAGDLNYAKAMTLSVVGQPRIYPEDWYRFEPYFALVLPSPLIWINQDKTEQAATLPLGVDLSASGSMNGYDLTLVQPLGRGPTDGVTYVYISHNLTTKIYIFTLASIPLIMTLLFSYLFFRASTEVTRSPEALLALAAYLIAILPLRAVLIPQDVPGFTYVDTLLGLGLIALAIVILSRYAFSEWPEPIAFVLKRKRTPHISSRS